MADTPSERRAAGFVRANTSLTPHALSSVQSERPLTNEEEEQRLLRAPSIKPHVPKLTAWQRFKKGTGEVILGSKLNILLLFLPAAIVLNVIEMRHDDDGKAKLRYDAAVFVVSLIALCPLAERLGFITEELAMHTNDTIGGLLNATFGNATEVIICGFALRKANNDSSFLRVVQLSLLGSVLSNLLLVLGSAFLIGGIVHPSQSFNQEGMTVNSGLLVMSVTAILLPSTLKATHTGHESTEEFYGKSSELNLSRFESVFLLAAYGLYLMFQLCTHRHLYEDDEDDEIEGNCSHEESDDSEGSIPQEDEPLDRRLSSFQNRQQAGEGIVIDPLRVSGEDLEDGDREDSDDGERDGGELSVPLMARTPGKRALATLSRRMTRIREDELGAQLGNIGALRRQVESTTPVAEISKAPEGPVLGLTEALAWLTVVTILIALLSEYVVDSIQGAATGLDIPIPFLSTIVLPIVGNAAEHASAILFAYKNRMEITLGVAVGSSTQVAVLVIPFCVVLAWIMGEDLDLNFQAFEAMALFLSVLLTVVAMHDGTSNWLKGVMLSMTYIFISAAFWVHRDKELDPHPAALLGRRLLVLNPAHGV